jgi:hypothetical protein
MAASRSQLPPRCVSRLRVRLCVSDNTNHAAPEPFNGRLQDSGEVFVDAWAEGFAIVNLLDRGLSRASNLVAGFPRERVMTSHGVAESKRLDLALVQSAGEKRSALCRTRIASHLLIQGNRPEVIRL